MTPSTTLAATVESALNQWIKLDQTSLSRLKKLQGKMIEWKLTGLNLSLFFFCESDRIQVLSNYEGEADTCIIASPAGIGQVISGNSEKALFNGMMKIEGDTETGTAFQDLLKKVDFDWEEQLSHFTGDIIAHQAGNLLRTITDFVNQTRSTIHENLSEYLTEETRVLPTKPEVDYFITQVDQLRAGTDRLEARVKRLQSRRKAAE